MKRPPTDQSHTHTPYSDNDGEIAAPQSRFQTSV